MRSDERGFTLIELLVTMMIVALLAAVAIPVFVRQTNKGFQDQVRSALRDAATAAESYAHDTLGDFSGLDGDDGTLLAAEGFPADQWIQEFDYLTVVAGRSSYCIEVRHARLPAGDPWRTAIYQSSLGYPVPSPGSCPAP